MLRALKSVGNPDFVFDPKFLSTKHNNEVNISVKNYKQKNGMSTTFFDPMKKNHTF